MLLLKIFTTMRSPVKDVLLIPILSPLCGGSSGTYACNNQDQNVAVIFSSMKKSPILTSLILLSSSLDRLSQPLCFVAASMVCTVVVHCTQLTNQMVHCTLIQND